MKKFYSMLVALIVAAFAITASAASFTIKIDHPERIVISGGYAQIPDPLTAESVITYEPNEYRNLTISAIGNNYIKSALDPEGNPINENYYGYVIYLEEKYDGEVFTITTGDLAEDREASEDFFTLTVDRPEKVSLTYSNTSKPISLKAAPEENVIKFLPDRDVPLSLDALENSSTTLFYSVKLNNEEQTPAYYGNYELKPRKGDKVDVKFDFPAQECKVKLSLLDGIDVKDALTKVEAFRGAEKIDITPALEMTVSAGYYLYLYFNEDWDYQAYQVNGEDVKPMYSSQIKLPVRSDVDLQVDIEPYPDYTVSLTVDNPANVTVKKYVGNDYVAITDLQAGANDIAVSSKNPNLRITPVAGSFISSIKDADGNNAKFDTYYKYYEIKAKDGENKWTIVSGAYPTDPVRVNFVRADGDTRNFNDYVINVGELVDGTSTAVEIDKDGFTALPGHTYKIYRNEVDYDWNSCSFADDSDPSSKVNALYNEFMVVAGGKISISATENEKITFTLNVDDPEHLTLYKAYSSYDPLRNITIPVSAGNNTKNEWPSLDGRVYNYKEQFPLGDISLFSSYGTLNDGRRLPFVCAPGAAIVSSTSHYYTDQLKSNPGVEMLYQARLTEKNRTNYWQREQGTSMSTPFVAGAIATWLEADPTLTVGAIKEIITSTAVNDDNVANSGNPVQWGAGKFSAIGGLKEVIRRSQSGIEGITSGESSPRPVLTSDDGRRFNIFLGGSKKLTAELFSMTGVRVLEATSQSDELTLDATGIEAGVYVLRINGAHATKITVK